MVFSESMVKDQGPKVDGAWSTSHELNASSLLAVIRDMVRDMRASASLLPTETH